MKRRGLVIAVLIGALGLGALGWVSLSTSPTQISVASDDAAARRCDASASGSERTVCYSDYLVSVLDEEGVAPALASFAELRQRSGGIPDCHVVLHELGSRAWVKYGSNAFVTVEQDCASGYLHGTMTGAAKDGKLSSVVLPLCSDGLPGWNSQNYVECLHGIGHAVIESGMGIDKGREVCEKVGDRSLGACLTGIVMAYSEQEERSTEEIFTLCEAFADGSSMLECTMAGLAVATNHSDVVAMLNEIHGICQGTAKFEGCAELYANLGAVTKYGSNKDPGTGFAGKCSSLEGCPGFYGEYVYRNLYSVERSETACRELTESSRESCVEGVRMASRPNAGA